MRSTQVYTLTLLQIDKINRHKKRSLTKGPPINTLGRVTTLIEGLRR